MVRKWPQSRLGSPTKILPVSFIRPMLWLFLDVNMCEAGSVALGDPVVSKTATVPGMLMLQWGTSVNEILPSGCPVVRAAGDVGWAAAGSGPGHQGRAVGPGKGVLGDHSSALWGKRTRPLESPFQDALGYWDPG